MKESQKVKEKFYKDGHVILGEHYSNKVKKLYELYESDKFKARVYFMNEKYEFENSRLVLFMKDNGDFDIVNFVRKYGISKTNRVYSREKRTFQLKFSKNKFTLIINNRQSRIIAPTLSNIINEEHIFSSVYDSNDAHDPNKEILNLLSERFAWVRFIRENISLHNISLNTFINKKLFTLKKALKYYFKCPYPVAKLFNDSKTSHNGITYVRHYMDYISNIESLKSSWVNERFDFVYDCLKMAKIVDKKINASWSDRRLKEEHDKWSKTINDIMFIDCDREMNISKVFLDFEKFSNYKIIKTTKRLAQEGLSMNHCVGSYVSNIENYSCAIYTLNKHTLELKRSWLKGKEVLRVGQLVTFSNAAPNETLKKEVIECVNNFNKKLQDDTWGDENNEEEEIFPF